jgi:hypothetical protein
MKTMPGGDLLDLGFHRASVAIDKDRRHA